MKLRIATYFLLGFIIITACGVKGDPKPYVESEQALKKSEEK